MGEKLSEQKTEETELEMLKAIVAIQSEILRSLKEKVEYLIKLDNLDNDPESPGIRAWQILDMLGEWAAGIDNAEPGKSG